MDDPLSVRGKVYPFRGAWKYQHVCVASHAHMVREKDQSVNDSTITHLNQASSNQTASNLLDLTADAANVLQYLVQ